MARGARGKINSGNLLSLIDILKVIREIGNVKDWRPFDVWGKFSALCPFHAERSASFVVCPVRQEYHCYACGAHGNAITFVREHLGSRNPIFDLAKLAVMRRWCTWRQVRGRSPSSIRPVLDEYIVPDYYVAPDYPGFYKDIPPPDFADDVLE